MNTLTYFFEKNNLNTKYINSTINELCKVLPEKSYITTGCVGIYDGVGNAKGKDFIGKSYNKSVLNAAMFKASSTTISTFPFIQIGIKNQDSLTSEAKERLDLCIGYCFKCEQVDERLVAAIDESINECKNASTLEWVYRSNEGGLEPYNAIASSRKPFLFTECFEVLGKEALQKLATPFKSGFFLTRQNSDKEAFLKERIDQGDSVLLHSKSRLTMYDTNGTLVQNTIESLKHNKSISGLIEVDRSHSPSNLLSCSTLNAGTARKNGETNRLFSGNCVGRLVQQNDYWSGDYRGILPLRTPNNRWFGLDFFASHTTYNSFIVSSSETNNALMEHVISNTYKKEHEEHIRVNWLWGVRPCPMLNVDPFCWIQKKNINEHGAFDAVLNILLSILPEELQTDLVCSEVRRWMRETQNEHKEQVSFVLFCKTMMMEEDNNHEQIIEAKNYFTDCLPEGQHGFIFYNKENPSSFPTGIALTFSTVQTMQGMLYILDELSQKDRDSVRHTLIHCPYILSRVKDSFASGDFFSNYYRIIQKMGIGLVMYENALPDKNSRLGRSLLENSPHKFIDSCDFKMDEKHSYLLYCSEEKLAENAIKPSKLGATAIPEYLLFQNEKVGLVRLSY
ncbi:hypothetical protein A3715_15610 [Oleiphilus sp. HI0009]|nr:hypothetical protein A3715_15610 [Oleiphilus sp. HI0009]